MNTKLGKENAVERVKKIKDYAFVHFKDRDDALQAMELSHGEPLASILLLAWFKNVDSVN